MSSNSDPLLHAAANSLKSTSEDEVELIETPERLPPRAQELSGPPADYVPERELERQLEKEERKKRLKWHDDMEERKRRKKEKKQKSEEEKTAQPAAQATQTKRRLRGTDVAEAVDALIAEKDPYYRVKMAAAAALVAGGGVYMYAPAIIAAMKLL
jgi:hypothetical protein